MKYSSKLLRVLAPALLAVIVASCSDDDGGPSLEFDGGADAAVDMTDTDTDTDTSGPIIGDDTDTTATTDDTDATVATDDTLTWRFRQAGLVFIGKTNTPFLQTLTRENFLQLLLTMV